MWFSKPKVASPEKQVATGFCAKCGGCFKQVSLNEQVQVTRSISYSHPITSLYRLNTKVAAYCRTCMPSDQIVLTVEGYMGLGGDSRRFQIVAGHIEEVNAEPCKECVSQSQSKKQCKGGK